jgi:membrane-associated phospholipid phosphatase
MDVTIALVITVFVAALVATARMVLSAHSPADVYAGLLVGILSQLLAYAIIG